jgi:hypothetical protein
MKEYLKKAVNVYFASFYVYSIIEIIVYSSTSDSVYPSFIESIFSNITGSLYFIGSLIFFPFGDLLRLSYPSLMSGFSEIVYYIACLFILILFCLALEQVRQIIVRYMSDISDTQKLIKNLSIISRNFILIFLIAFIIEISQNIYVAGIQIESIYPVITGGLSNISLIISLFAELFKRVMQKQIHLEKEINSII